MRTLTCLVLLVLAAPASQAALVNVTPYFHGSMLMEEGTGSTAYGYSGSIDIDATCYYTSAQFVPGTGTANAVVGGGICGISSATASLAMAVTGDSIAAEGQAASTTTGRPVPTTGIDSQGFSTVNLVFAVDQASSYSLTALFSGLDEDKQGYLTYAKGYGTLVLYEDGAKLHELGSQDVLDAALLLSGVELSGVLMPGREYRLFVQYYASTRNYLVEGRSQPGGFGMQLALVPIPSAFLAFGGALAALFACRRREKYAAYSAPNR